MTYPPQDPYGQQPAPYGQQPSGPYQQQPYGQYPQPGYPYGPGMNPASQDTGMAVGALVCSLIGLFLCGGTLSIVGVILGHIARAKAKRGEAGGEGMALAALIIGYFAIALIIIGIGVFVAFGIATHWRFR
ncbi:protein of unknown function [Amycolatopsis xylanica]|uniref:DUF4190 domain-containing protein n=1 Tax=Amycolatopsis xylanica TaxID=589385 RepID=A0A1H3T9Z7_9PSEU|nr:DUF4190 domain-containing protein [Amycolatopsis xylanica]SDZ47054.1 protein of unknown function [Amycolatopsis xylanica]